MCPTFQKVKKKVALIRFNAKTLFVCIISDQEKCFCKSFFRKLKYFCKFETQYFCKKNLRTFNEKHRRIANLQRKVCAVQMENEYYLKRKMHQTIIKIKTKDVFRLDFLLKLVFKVIIHEKLFYKPFLVKLHKCITKNVIKKGMYTKIYFFGIGYRISYKESFVKN